MNVLIVYSIYNYQTFRKPIQTLESIQFGISYISSVLKSNGHNTKLLVLNRALKIKANIDLLYDCITKYNPELICYTTVSTEYKFIRDMSKYVRSKYPGIYQLIGGPHASLCADEVIRDGFNAVCIGEGEYPTLELITQLEKGEEPSNIMNLWIKRCEGIEKNAPRPFIQDLDALPFPDRDMWKEWIDEGHTAKYAILLGRGCAFQCTYCSNHALKKLAPGKYVRFRSPDNIINEIKEIIATNSIIPEEIYLEIETIGLNYEWALELCSKLKSLNDMLSKPISYGVNLRITPNLDVEPLFMAFKSCNIRFINIGLESGSDRVRKEILRRNYSNKDIINAIELLRKYGLKVNFFNLIGIPGETLDDYKETVKINRICLPDWHLTSIFYPYPGTDLYLTCQEQNLLAKPLDDESERLRAILDLPGFSKRQIQRSFNWFDYDVYKGHKPVYILFMKVMYNKINSNRHLNHAFIILSNLTPFKHIIKMGFGVSKKIMIK